MALLCCSTHKWQTYVHKEKTWVLYLKIPTTNVNNENQAPPCNRSTKVVIQRIQSNICAQMCDIAIWSVPARHFSGTTTTATCNTHLQGCRPSPRMMLSRGRDIIHARPDLFLPDAWAVPRKQCSVPPPPLLLQPAMHICKVAHQALGWCQVENVISYMQDLIYSC